MKRALITGATGFLGSHITKRLLAENWEVIAITSGSPKWRFSTQEINSIRWIKVFQEEQTLFRSTEIDLFINCAVEYQNQKSLEKDLEHSNIHLPLNIINTLNIYGHKTTSIIFDSFFSKYPANQTPQPIYTKQKKELVKRLKSQQKTNNNRSIVIRLEHLYGPGDNPRKIIPAVADKLLAHAERISLTNALSQRDLIYIDDAIDAIFLAYEAAPTGFSLIDCGTGHTRAMRDVFDLLKAITNSKSILGYGDIDHHDKITESKADIYPLKAWGWMPKIALMDGLTSVVMDTKNRI